MSAAPGAVLVARDLRKRFGGVAAVAGVSFAVAPGEMLALIGPNGAGKSTCFNLLSGQLLPDAGRITLDGRDITGLRPQAVWRLGVGRSFQHAAIFASMSARENVQTALLSQHRQVWRFWHAADRHAPEAADRLLDQVGLGDQAGRAAGALAYGDRKRLELALALANDPHVLLMDEPVAGMAPGERHDLMALTRRLATERAIAVLFTEHDMDVVFRVADRILVMNRGALIAEGSPATIRADPEVRAAYLGTGEADQK